MLTNRRSKNRFSDIVRIAHEVYDKTVEPPQDKADTSACSESHQTGESQKKSEK